MTMMMTAAWSFCLLQSFPSPTKRVVSHSTLTLLCYASDDIVFLSRLVAARSGPTSLRPPHRGCCRLRSELTLYSVPSLSLSSKFKLLHFKIPNFPCSIVLFTSKLFDTPPLGSLIPALVRTSTNPQDSQLACTISFPAMNRFSTVIHFRKTHHLFRSFHLCFSVAPSSSSSLVVLKSTIKKAKPLHIRYQHLVVVCCVCVCLVVAFLLPSVCVSL
jgi:hypothetical protein